MFDWDPASLGLTTKLPKLKYNEAGRGEEGVEGPLCSVRQVRTVVVMNQELIDTKGCHYPVSHHLVII